MTTTKIIEVGGLCFDPDLFVACRAVKHPAKGPGGQAQVQARVYLRAVDGGELAYFTCDAGARAVVDAVNAARAPAWVQTNDPVFNPGASDGQV